MRKEIKYVLRRLGLAAKVNSFIIGAQKSGTTSLHEALAQHSLCLEAPFKKELHFWSSGPGPNSLIEYENLFPFVSTEFRLLDSTPNYLNEPGVVKAIFRYNPKAKFIVLLRNPTKRAFSAWSMFHHSFQKGGQWRGIDVHDPRDFQDAISEEWKSTSRKAYLAMGHYAEQLRPFLDIVPRENLLIAVVEEDVYPDSETFLAHCQSFLEIPFEPLQLPKSNTSRNPSKLSDYPSVFLQQLNDYFAPHNDELRKLLGRELKSWHE